MSFGRDLRRDIFQQVNSYSAREVGRFGAPSLITRITNDVQQVQMLVVLACTMMIAAPITMVFGIIFAIREDAALSVIMLVAIPVLVGVLAIIITRMVPTFQVMQLRVDRVNAVLRDQITGIRVVRAFVREPVEVERFAGANDELTRTSLRAGRLMALMFPTVTLFISLSSVAVLWLGATRIESGDMELGSVVAYLSYLVQVLIAVVMLTFMVSMLPRAAVAADRIVEVLDTDSSVTPPTDPITEVTEHGTVDFERRRLHLSRCRAPGAVRHLVQRPPGSDHRDHREHRIRQVDARRPRAPPVRRHRGNRLGQRCRRPPPRSRPALGVDRLRPAEALSLLRDRCVEPALRTARRHRRGVVAGARDRTGRRLRPVDARGPRQPDHPGRHQRVGWPASTVVDRPGAGAPARPLRLRRLVLGARPRDRRPTPARPATRTSNMPAC